MSLPTPDGCRALASGLLPQRVYEYKRQPHATPGLSQLSQTLWAADDPESGHAVREWRLQQQQQREGQHDHHMQRQQQNEEREHDLQMRQQYHFKHPASASAATSAVTVDSTAEKTALSYSPRDTTYRNGGQDALHTVSQTVPRKELQGSEIRSQQQPSAPKVPATQSAHATEIRHVSQAVVLAQTISMAEPPKSPPSLHSGERPYVCPVCGKAYARQYHLNRHAIYCGPTTDHCAGRLYSCDECPQWFTFKASLIRHKMLHSGERRYVCQVCGKAYARKDQLNRHANYCGPTTKDCAGSPFPCDECPQQFDYRCSLIRHKMLHSGVRPYVCHVCDKAFFRKDHMIKHTKTHDGH